MADIDPRALARQADDPFETLREDLEDTLKEYGELDVLVELLQNALDAIDLRRYRAICAAAGRTPDDAATGAWNAAVLQALSDDQQEYESQAGRGAANLAVYYEGARNDDARRQSWWERLAESFGGQPEGLEAAAQERGALRVTVRVGPPHWIEVEDDGGGIAEIVEAFQHRESEKRRLPERQRRLGVRGSHGWGLTSVLGFSNRVEVVSHIGTGTPRAFAFSDYAAFARGDVAQPRNEELDLETLGVDHPLSQRLRRGASTGTHVRVQLGDTSNTNVLGHTLENFSHAAFDALLRLYTPVGQVNDYVAHPAFHTVRERDVTVQLISNHEGAGRTTTVPFDYYTLDGNASLTHYSYKAFVDAGHPRGKSVHTIHRSLSGDTVLLSAADIQSAKALADLADEIRAAGRLPGRRDELGDDVYEIPRGFQLALSGGMRSEHLARPPRAASAAFRGIILSETARPTLGRKYVMDQREAIPRGAQRHERAYDDIRKLVIPAAEPPPTSPRAARWRRDFFEATRGDLEGQVPLSDAGLWFGAESREARVMHWFAFLLAKEAFGELILLRGHLTEIYDFVFVQRADIAGPIPARALADRLIDEGWATKHAGSYARYGIGEFKADGEDLLQDFDPTSPRKAPDTPDLLVCWNFTQQVVEEYGWTVEAPTAETKEFAGQTHLWLPRTAEEQKRSRALAVIALEDLIQQLVADDVLPAPPRPWPDALPPVYF